MSTRRNSSPLSNEDFNDIKKSITEESQPSLQNIEQELEQLKEKAKNDRDKFLQQIQTLKKQLQHGIGSLEDSNEERNRLAKKSQKLKRDRNKLLEQITKLKQKMLVLTKNNMLLQNKVRELLHQKGTDNETNIETNLHNEHYSTVNIKNFERPFMSMTDITDRSELTEVTDNEDFDFSSKSPRHTPKNKKTFTKAKTGKKKFLSIRFKKKKSKKKNTYAKDNNTTLNIKEKDKGKHWPNRLTRRKTISVLKSKDDY
ncbi:fyve and coiled-coil domain containing 1 [Anaeramoeba flamelloides]|uniref:Fyve and coiled-coil domain containing 1 n=1 Tax=Anaeramoeba flamelloides TaxID=1746091 RepID=A0ABQ8ZBG8_9EUKA|nr:fyve and coiled-coil domain containing 1 [Anaeramoeba flamelloides]